MKYRIITNGLQFQLQGAENIGEYHDVFIWHPVTTGGWKRIEKWWLPSKIEYYGDTLNFNSKKEAAEYVIETLHGELQWTIV